MSTSGAGCIKGVSGQFCRKEGLQTVPSRRWQVNDSLAGIQELAGSLQSLCWASAAVGGIASAYFSGSLVESYGPRTVFGVTAIFPLIVSGAALLIAEQPVRPMEVATGAGELAYGDQCLHACWCCCIVVHHCMEHGTSVPCGVSDSIGGA